MSYRYEEVKPTSPLKIKLIKCGMVVCGVLAVFFFLRSLPPSWLPGGVANIVSPANASATQTVLKEVLQTRPIRDIRPGQRVLSENPELNGQKIEPLEIDPKHWRLITFEQKKANGQSLKVELLRRLYWLQIMALVRATDEKEKRIVSSDITSDVSVDQDWIQEALIGHTIELNLVEFGAVGSATVKKIEPCPKIETGQGRIVTGKFSHKAANIINVGIKGLKEPIGTTDNHPFWSEERQKFIPAGELRVGEKLISVNGKFLYVTSISPRGPPEDVFNIEVYGEHTYYVSESGVLVHNACASQKLGQDLIDNGYGKPGKGYQAAHLIPTGAFSNRADDVVRAIKNTQDKFDDFLDPKLRNTLINGFWAKPGHAGTHTNKFFREMGRLFEDVSDEPSAQRAMKSLWDQVKKGKFIE